MLQLSSLGAPPPFFNGVYEFVASFINPWCRVFTCAVRQEPVHLKAPELLPSLVCLWLIAKLKTVQHEGLIRGKCWSASGQIQIYQFEAKRSGWLSDRLIKITKVPLISAFWRGGGCIVTPVCSVSVVMKFWQELQFQEKEIASFTGTGVFC